MTSFFLHSWLKAWRPASRAARQRTRRPVAQLRMVDLEDRLLLTCVVTNNVIDGGSGTFRQAILNANAGQCGGRIEFNIGSGPRDIRLDHALPDITRTVVIDGTTQPGAFTGMQFRGRHPLITLSGAFSRATVDGLIIGANYCVVRGLTVVGFSNGIRLFSSGNTVEDSFIGTDPYQPNNAGNRGAGIGVYGVANIIRNNLISGNGWVGLDLPGTTVNVVQGNYIGTDGAGTGAILPRQGGGVLVREGDNNTIQDNLISGNGAWGVALTDGTSTNVVRGNYIGTNYNGTAAVGNGQEGVRISNGAHHNTIGPNVIAGNNGAGVGIFDSGTSSNKVVGNYIGTDVSGRGALGNAQGLWIDRGTSGNTIGGSLAGDGNLISGNRGQGVYLAGLAFSNVVQGNKIGTDVSGTVALGNSHGVWLDFVAYSNTIGGSLAGDGNLISGNRAQGVVLTGDASSNVVQGNKIGTDVSGTVALRNANDGVWLGYGANYNTIGGTNHDPGVCNRACNVIAGNSWGGVTLVRTDTVGNVVQGNFIGTDVSGSLPLGNGAGVWLDGASGNTIGGDVPAAGNMIVSNQAEGIKLLGGARNNTVLYNSIGTDAAGQAVLGNALAGVAIINSSSTNHIWYNTIAYNGGSGIQVGTDAADLSVGNWLSRNAIFANAALGIDLGNDGVTPNHDYPPPPGPNNWQNYPVLAWASSDGVSTTVAGTLQSTPDTRFVLEFFINNALDPSYFGQGEQLLGTLEVTTDATGLADFTTTPITLPAAVPGQFLTATATDTQRGNTSEFSADVVIADAGAAPTISLSRAVAGALGRVEALRSAPPVLLPHREGSSMDGLSRLADRVAFWSDGPGGAALDHFVGGAALPTQGAPRHGTAAVSPNDDLFFLGAGPLASDGW